MYLSNATVILIPCTTEDCATMLLVPDTICYGLHLIPKLSSVFLSWKILSMPI